MKEKSLGTFGGIKVWISEENKYKLVEKRLENFIIDHKEDLIKLLEENGELKMNIRRN